MRVSCSNDDHIQGYLNESSDNVTFMRNLPSLREGAPIKLQATHPVEVQTEGGIKSVHADVTVFVPPGVDIIANILEAQQMSASEFYDAVRNKGKWDYKQLGKNLSIELSEKYQDFGNFNFGMAAKAFGIPEIIARMGAGAAQILAGTSEADSILCLLKYPYCDDVRDQEMIGEGFKAFDNIENSRDDKMPRIKESDFDKVYLDYDNKTLP
ncbi:MAG: polymorphic toxin type 44 domain-containing protein [Geobacteraceae bacterium]|nr:polymorphic toxin type 44 domain-containing protein [Geobacteraceae bacterium]